MVGTRAKQSKRHVGTLAVAVASLIAGLSCCAAADTLADTLEEAVPPALIRHALACTAVPLWLQQATPIVALRDAPGPAAFFYPYNHTIYLRATPYLREGHRWDVFRLAVMLGHEFGHAFQRVAAPPGSAAWSEFERLTPGFENVPVGERTYRAWRRNRAEAFAEAYRVVFGGIGAQTPPLVPLTVTPAIRAYFQQLNVSAGEDGPHAGVSIARQCVAAPGAVGAESREPIHF